MNGVGIMNKADKFSVRLASLLAPGLMLGLMLGLAGCSSSTEVASDLGMEDAPDWVNEGSQALNSDDGRLIHGIGSAPKMSDFSLQRSTADDRARAEVARVLSSYMNVVSQDYLATAGMGDDSVDEQVITRQVENVSRLNVAGAVIIGRWRDPENGAVWSIAELDLDKVKRVVSSAESMNADFQQYFEKHGETLFDRFSREN